jgi:acetyltransferase
MTFWLATSSTRRGSRSSSAAIAIDRRPTGLSQMAVDFPAVVGVDINPLLADASGAIALDARIEIDPSRAGERGTGAHLAIRPYPDQATTRERLGDLALTVRAIRPEDALYPAFLDHTDPEDLRLRFLAPIATISDDLLIRLTQLDYDRDFAFVAIDEANATLCGICRYSADPDRERAEFGMLVRSDLKGRGIGILLMRRLIGYAPGRRDRAP